MFENNKCIWFAILVFIFLSSNQDKKSTPLNFDTLFEVGNSSSIFRTK